MSKSYYNENDRFAAAWLRELIADGLIAQGEVDERSILDVRPADLAGFDQCHFFAGIGGWSYALRLAGWPDDRPVWTGSCPCQPLSSAGQQKGHADERHVWPAFYELIAECGPPTVFGEQVASKIGREWLAGVRVDLEDARYAVGAADLCAAGSPQVRQRIFWVAHAAIFFGRSGSHHKRSCGQGTLEVSELRNRCGYEVSWQPGWPGGEPETLVVADGIPNRVGTLRGAGNAVVPQVAAEFIGSYLQ